MFAAFVLIVVIAFVTITCRTYYRRWRSSRDRIDPGAGERSRLQRARNDSQPNIGPHHGGPPGVGSGSGFGP
jgi:hypothetical protein